VGSSDQQAQILFLFFISSPKKTAQPKPRRVLHFLNFLYFLF